MQESRATILQQIESLKRQEMLLRHDLEVLGNQWQALNAQMAETRADFDKVESRRLFLERKLKTVKVIPARKRAPRKPVSYVMDAVASMSADERAALLCLLQSA